MPTSDLLTSIKDILGPEDLPSEILEFIKIFTKTGQSPELKEKNLGGVNGEHERSNGKSVITLDSQYGKNSGTLSHELTHALDPILGNAYTDIQRNRRSLNSGNTTPEERQFADGYSKLTDRTKLPIDSKVSDYRRSGHEMRAFGVGNMVGKYPTNAINPHVDASIATDQAVLRDLFLRALNGK